MTLPINHHAAAIAEALAEKGIVSDAPEADPNPFWAAQQAFYVCEGRKNPGVWRDWKQSLTVPFIPRAEYYRRLAIICRRALRHPDMRDDLREAVAYAWGYFAALLKAGARDDAGDEAVDK